MSDNCDNLVFMLWGNDAQKHANSIDQTRHCVLEWRHPSPLAQASASEEDKFINTDNFTDATLYYESTYSRDINWNVSQTTFVYTDGACKNNGRPNAKGGYGAYFQKGPLKNLKIAAPLPHATYQGIDMKQTNNRAEMLATIDALTVYYNKGCVGNIILVTDSELTMKTINIWLSSWVRDEKVDQRKNADLLWELNSILLKVRSRQEEYDHELTVIWTKAHVEKKHAPEKGTKKYKLWDGNRIADDLANDGVILSERVIYYENSEDSE